MNPRPLAILALALLAAPAGAQDRPPEYWENYKPSHALDDPHSLRIQPRLGSHANAAAAWFDTWDTLHRKDTLRLHELASNLPERGHKLPADLRAELLKRQPYIDALMKTAAVEHCDWGIAWEAGWEFLLPHLGYLRNSARVLTADAIRCAQEGSTLAAIDRVRAIVRTSHHAAEGPVLISSMVGIAICNRAIHATDELLDFHNLTPAQARALLAIFRSIPRKDLYHTGAALLKEQDVSINWLRDKFRGKQPGLDFARTMGTLLGGPNEGTTQRIVARMDRDQFDRDLQRADKLFDELNKAWNSDNPVPRLQELADEVNEFQWGLLALTMTPSYERARASVKHLERSLTKVESRLAIIAQPPNDPQEDTREH